MTEEERFADGLIHHPDRWMAFGSATGAAVVTPETLLAVGRTPAPGEIRALVAWLEDQDQDEVFATDRLGAAYPGAATYAEFASGLLALRASKIHPSWVLWFRPEVARTVTWGGDPTKPAAGPDQRLSPRTSFAAWKEEVRGRSAPWSPEEIEAAGELRAAIIGVVLRGAEERAELSDQLQRTNKELEAFSYSISHDLRAPFRHIAGFAELLRERETVLDDKSRHYLESIREAALSAGRLVDDLLNFSQLGRATLTTAPIDMNKLIVEAQRTLSQDIEGHDIVWKIGDLPPAWGDGAMLRQVWINLIGNAVKYSRNARPSQIEIFSEETPQARVYGVRDNGVGFDMAYVGKLFGVFQRLHRVDEFEGTGIGLAISKGVVERHGGRIWAEGRLGEGAIFRFTLPRIETGRD
jgi:light-regulated signal transduction histidine kinase (bacteriophytochrome)